MMNPIKLMVTAAALAGVFSLLGAAHAMRGQQNAVHPGQKVYQKANCIGCHKWHGGGGGGYGGAALSLRTSVLDAELMKLVVRCGRPGTGMPFHQRGAYKGDDTSCYGITAHDLGDKVPPRARSFLRDRQLDQVVDYVLTVLKGKGEPTREECVVFWGESSRQCSSM